ncbi:unnamed protein product [Echinostoma caproni]|uniref:CLASP_N domain-containing protein n=1 Tax=Echinostoma caproni TaxID=27848 RepID=A0A183A5T6_9TREM|nr:unnamed protein product [Echinostoma caproni]
MGFRICIGPYTEDSGVAGSSSARSGNRSGSTTTETGVALLCSAFLRDQLTNLVLESKAENPNFDVTLSTNCMVRTHAFHLVASLIICSPSDELSPGSNGSPSSPSPLTILRQNLATAGSTGYLLEQQVCRPPMPKTNTDPVICQSLATSESIWTEHFKRAVSLAIEAMKHSDSQIRQAALLVVGNALYRFSRAFELIEKHLETLVSILAEDNSARIRSGAAEKCFKCLTPVFRLLEAGCTDGDRRVQEASLLALRLHLVACPLSKKILNSLGAMDKLMQLQTSLKRASASRSGRLLPGKFRQTTKQSPLLDNALLIEYTAAICDML